MRSWPDHQGSALQKHITSLFQLSLLRNEVEDGLNRTERLAYGTRHLGYDREGNGEPYIGETNISSHPRAT
jgi:hypothetical protein